MSKIDGAENPFRLAVEYLSTASLIPDPRNARKHPKAQLVKLQAGIREFGFNVPIVIDERDLIIAGNARAEVAQASGMETVPCVRVEHLTEAQKRAFALADNKLGDLSHFDPAMLASELAALCAIEFPVELTGFATAEIDVLLDAGLNVEAVDPADDIPEEGALPVSHAGDLWLLGSHRLLCGDALASESYEQLLGDERADLIFADMPYNVPIQGHVSGLGKKRHREFKMASGEMSPAEFTRFLTTAMTNMARFSVDGSIHYQCMDWRHMREILDAGAAAYSELKAVCIWDKGSGGMGSLYRSQHEVVFVFKNGKAPHINNVQLGKYGRFRTNVWSYPGINRFGANRDAALAMHPTVKPVALVADAIRDCSKRNALVLDPFAGSGTTIIAADRTGRRAVAMELDPLYVDTAVRRWQTVTGKTARLAGDGRSFADIESERTSTPHPSEPSGQTEAGNE